MTVRDRFAETYRESRARFGERCRRLGLAVDTWELDRARGPDGEVLATDAVRIGRADAERVLILVSATHGIEGFCGAGVQNALLRMQPTTMLPDSVALILVHALNPSGFAHLRRTNEDNVDLNRNFLAEGREPPANPAYDEIHELLVPADWDGPAHAAADRALNAYRARHGARALQAATCGGQWDHADGLFYGGRAPVWSHRTWHRILERFAGAARLAGVIDFHTGLGERGACELISGAPAGSDEARLAQRWFGPAIVAPGGESTAPAAQGYMGTSLARALPQAASALVVAEFGTVPFDEILRVLRADNWLHARGDPASPLGRKIKADMKAAFFGADAAWQDAILDRSLALVRHALTAIADTPLDHPAGVRSNEHRCH